MAGRVVRDPVRVVRAHVLHAEHVHEELGQLVDGRRVRAKLLAHHARAGCRGRHDGLVPLEHPGKPARQREPLVGVAAVQMHLPAAGLLLGELHLHAEPVQQPHDRLPGGREQRVAEAGDEETDAHVE